jgi:hypothetical protein
MGSGSSIQRISSDESAQPLLKQGGDGQGRASAESASLVGKAETLVKYGTCPDIPDIPDLEIPRMRISEDRVLQLGLPEDLDLKDRTRYEHGLFRLCFPAGMFEECKDGEPPTFGTAIVPKKPILRELVEHAITFVDHVMHYIVDTMRHRAKTVSRGCREIWERLGTDAATRVHFRVFGARRLDWACCHVDRADGCGQRLYRRCSLRTRKCGECARPYGPRRFRLAILPIDLPLYPY